MGRFNEVLVGVGKNREEAFRAAWDDYVYENGHRCSFRGHIAAERVARVPPDKPYVERRGPIELRGVRPDPTAPDAEWLERWKFEVWVHA